MSFNFVRRWAAVVSVCLALGVLFSGASVALADQEKGHAGVVGPHSLPDTLAGPAVTCGYGELTTYLSSYTVQPPMVRARSRTRRVDQQRVGWRFIVKRVLQGTTQMTTVYKSPVQKKNAYDNQDAPFTAMAAMATGAADADFYVFIKMSWYRSDGSTEGTATHLVDYYREHISTAPDYVFGPNGRCPGRYLF